jgi:hypothetical protein
MAKFNLTHSIIVKSDLENVFEHISNPDQIKNWVSNLVELRNYTPPISVGTTYDMITKSMGQETLTTSKVLTYDVPKKFAVSADSSSVIGTFTHSCQALTDGVEVTIHWDMEMSGLIMNLFAPIAKYQMNKLIQEDLNNIKTLVEA